MMRTLNLRSFSSSSGDDKMGLRTKANGARHGGADVREKQDGGGKAVLEDGEKGCGI